MAGGTDVDEIAGLGVPEGDFKFAGNVRSRDMVEHIPLGQLVREVRTDVDRKRLRGDVAQRLIERIVVKWQLQQRIRVQGRGGDRAEIAERRAQRRAIDRERRADLDAGLVREGVGEDVRGLNRHLAFRADGDFDVERIAEIEGDAVCRPIDAVAVLHEELLAEVERHLGTRREAEVLVEAQRRPALQRQQIVAEWADLVRQQVDERQQVVEVHVHPDDLLRAATGQCSAARRQRVRGDTQIGGVHGCRQSVDRRNGRRQRADGIAENADVAPADVDQRHGLGGVDREGLAGADDARAQDLQVGVERDAEVDVVGGVGPGGEAGEAGGEDRVLHPGDVEAERARPQRISATLQLRERGRARDEALLQARLELRRQREGGVGDPVGAAHRRNADRADRRVVQVDVAAADRIAEIERDVAVGMRGDRKADIDRQRNAEQRGQRVERGAGRVRVHIRQIDAEALRQVDVPLQIDRLSLSPRAQIDRGERDIAAGVERDGGTRARQGHRREARQGAQNTGVFIETSSLQAKTSTTGPRAQQQQARLPRHSSKRQR